VSQLDDATQALLDSLLESPDGVRAAVFARCWPDSAWDSRVSFEIHAGETVDDAAARLALPWSPGWLLEAGHRVADGGGNDLSAGQRAAEAGAVSWTPAPRLPHLDDQVADTKAADSLAGRKRLAGEVAVAALWRAAAALNAIPDGARVTGLGGQARGARFKHAVAYYLDERLPAGWSVLVEFRLKTIHGLHLRRDVPDRQADIAVLDDAPRLVSMISSKWSWRSDRGTEAAQMMSLGRYRPDIPYILVTTEFVRLQTILNENVEDRTYHLCPGWAAAWFEVYKSLDDGELPRERWPRLSDLADAGALIAETRGLGDLSTLVEDLLTSGRIE
jgi:hypothetical protein